MCLLIITFDAIVEFENFGENMQHFHDLTADFDVALFVLAGVATIA